MCWALQGAASGASPSALPALACCTWARGTSGPGRAEATRLHCVWAAAGPLSPLGRVPPAWWGLRKHGCADSGRKLHPLNCTQLGQGPNLLVLLPEGVGFGMILTPPLTHGTSQQWCRCLLRRGAPGHTPLVPSSHQEL